MAKRKATIKNFSSGMQPNQRSKNFGSASLVKNFNISNDNLILKPNSSFVDWQTAEDKEIGIVCIGGKRDEKIIGVGKALKNWYTKQYQYRVKLTPSSTGEVDYNYIDLSLMPSQFWQIVKDDGSDIAVADAENNLPLKHSLFIFDKDDESGSLVFEGNAQEVYVYFGNPSPTYVQQYEMYNDTYVAYPLDQNGNDFAHNSSEHFLYDLKNGTYFSPELGKIGRGFGGGGTAIYTDDDDNQGYIGAKASISFIFMFPQEDPLEEINLVQTESMTIYLYNEYITGRVETSNSTYTISSTQKYNDGNYHYVSLVYYGDSIYLYIDGVAVRSSSASGYLDNDYIGAIRVDCPSNADSVVEFVTINKIISKTSDRVSREASMILTNSQFWSVGPVEDISSINFEYSGVQIWERQVGEDSWKEYLINGAPVKNTDYHPTPSFLIYNNGTIFTAVNSSDSIFPSAQLSLAKIGYDEINFNKYNLYVSESFPRSVLGVDKAYYLKSGFSSVMKIDSGNNITNGVFTTYGELETSSQYGQYLALGVDAKNESYVQIWDMTSTTNSEFVDAGAGEIGVLGKVAGSLFIVKNNTLDRQDLSSGKKSLDILVWQGGSYAEPFLSFESKDAFPFVNYFDRPILNISENIKNGFTFYGKFFDEDGEIQKGLFAITKNAKNDIYAFSMINETIFDVLYLYRSGNILFVLDGEGGIYRTSDDDYSTPSVWQSTWWGGSSIDKRDQIKSIEVTFEPLEQNQTIKLEVRNESGEWKTVFEHSGENTTKREAKWLELTKEQFPSFNEMQLRLTSVNGSSGITSISVTLEDLLDG